MNKTALTLLLVASSALAQGGKDAPRAAAETYLKALSSGDDSGKQLLLGGVTMDAQMASVENWKILSEDPVRKETGDLKDAVDAMHALDKAGFAALNKMMASGKNSVGDDDVAMHDLSKEEAAKILQPTKQKRAAFEKKHPVLAYVARMKHEVYWHPKNPIRPLLAQAHGGGTYTLEVHRYMVESKEGQAQTSRQWPLRLVHFTADGVDTGWKVLPASDWATE